MRPNVPTILREVLDKILLHRPHLAAIVGSIPTAPSQCKKALADAYLTGETRLMAEETWELSACCDGRSYGG